MAELHVQKKKNRLWWLWLLVILVIAALVYFYLRGTNQLPGAVSNTSAAIFYSVFDAYDVLLYC